MTAREEAEAAVRLALRFDAGLKPDDARRLAKVAMGRLGPLLSVPVEEDNR